MVKQRILLVVQPSLSHYREPFVRTLLASDDYSFLPAGRFPVKGNSSQGRDSVNSASEDLLNQSERLVRKQLFGNFFWDQGLLKLILRKKYELVILEGNFYNFSSWVAAMLLRIIGRKSAFWGHGWKRPESGFKLKLRKFFYHLPQGHFVYGDTAREYAAKIGLNKENWIVVYNSLYKLNQLRCQEHGDDLPGDKMSLIFSGRLTKRHRVDLLIQAVNRLKTEENLSIELNIVGDGSERDSLTKIAGEGSQQINFLGAQHDFSVLKNIYSSSHFSVSPGASGLNVIQSLGFGVPVIAASADPQSGPEIEAVKDDVTGLLFEYENVNSLMDKIRYANEISATERGLMSAAGKILVETHYSAESHANAMLTGIKKILSS